MDQHSRAFVGIDTSKLRNAVAVAEDGRDGEKQIKVAAAPRAVREIAWKAQMRLCGRFRSLTRKGKRPTVVATAIARELSAFIWAINREVVGSHATANQ